jgi:hypothetical protein
LEHCFGASALDGGLLQNKAYAGCVSRYVKEEEADLTDLQIFVG